MLHQRALRLASPMLSEFFLSWFKQFLLILPNFLCIIVRHGFDHCVEVLCQFVRSGDYCLHVTVF